MALVTELTRRAVLYARVSKEEQASKDHFSIDAQINEMRECADERGWEVTATFVDDMSGTKMKRPELEAMLEMADGQGFDVLLVHELSRLSRASVYETLEIFQILGQHNIGFVSVKEPDFDFADPSRRFFLIILAALNQYYIDLLRIHTSKAKRQRARQGLYNASITPDGSQHDGGAQDPPIIVDEAAQAVRLIYEQYASGQHSMMAVAEMLNNAGYRARPSKKYPQGKRFGKAYIAKILRNPFYVGKVIYGTRTPHEEVEIFAGQHEAIISPELWERCQRIREGRRADSRSVQKPHRIYLLSKLARCDVCQRKLRSQGSPTATYYREMSYQGGHIDCPNRNSGTRTEEVDTYIHKMIEAIQLPDDWLEEIAQQLDDEDELHEIRRQRERLEAERRQLKLMKIRGEFDEDADLYNAEMKRIRQELDSLPTYDELESLKAAAASIQELSETWSEASSADQRDLLRLMLRAVNVDVPNKRVVSVVPQAVFIPILRAAPLLRERDFGTFIPVRSLEMIADTDSDLMPSLTEYPDNSVSLPFLAENPLQPDPHTLIAPGLSQAIEVCKDGDVELEMVVQCLSPGRERLPADMSKWPLAAEYILSEEEILARPRESIDVLSTQFCLWDQVAAGQSDEVEALLAQFYRTLTEGGVWYMQELLPLEMPAHWVYEYFPEVWRWARHQSWNFHSFYTALQSAGFTPEATRHVYAQSISLGVALEVVQARPGILALFSNRQFELGLERLGQANSEQDPLDLIGSEVALIEVWAKKIVSTTGETS